jgi:putative methionine-R-sulfoxide reductase with GAF domain
MRRNDNLPPSVSLSALQDTILTVGSSLDLPTVLRRVVEVIAQATDQTDAYIFLHDAEADDLVLSAATESAASPYVGALRMPLGEGVTRWVGATRQSYAIERDPQADDHFALRPELGEERYDSMICVPIVSRSERLIGVVSVWSGDAGHFTPEHVRLAEWIAVVVAGAIENAQLHASITRRASVLERFPARCVRRPPRRRSAPRASSDGLNARSYVFVVASVTFEQQASRNGKGRRSFFAGSPTALVSGSREPGVPPASTRWWPWCRCAARGCRELSASSLPPWAKALRQRLGAVATFGISSPTESVEDFRTALTEAREDVAVGSGMGAPGGVFTLDDVGHHLLLSRAAGLASVRDRCSLAITFPTARSGSPCSSP